MSILLDLNGRYILFTSFKDKNVKESKQGKKKRFLVSFSFLFLLSKLSTSLISIYCAGTFLKLCHFLIVVKSDFNGIKRCSLGLFGIFLFLKWDWGVDGYVRVNIRQCDINALSLNCICTSNICI